MADLRVFRVRFGKHNSITFNDERHEMTIARRRDPVREETVAQLSRALADGTLVDASTARLLGQNLYELLFFNAHANKWFEQVWESASELRLVLEFPASALQLISLPWEFLYVPQIRWRNGGRYLIEQSNVSLVRRVLRKPTDRGSSVIDKPRFLFIDCLPVAPGERPVPKSKAGKASATPPTREVDELMAFLETRGDVSFQRHPTFLDLRDFVARQPGPDVIHLVGHGRFQEGSTNRAFEFCLRPRDSGRDAREPEIWETDERIAEALAGRRAPRLVVLHTCKGGKVGSYKDYEGAAIALVKRGVSNVVALQHEIVMHEATAFVSRFYDAWAREMTLELAIREARGALRSSSDFSSCLPVVYAQHDEGLRLPPASAPRPSRGSGNLHAIEPTAGTAAGAGHGASVAAPASELVGVARRSPPTDPTSSELRNETGETPVDRQVGDSPLSVRFGGNR